MGDDILAKLRNLPTTKSIADRWNSVFTGIQVISNRVTPAHRDRKGRPEWFDLLVSIGDSCILPRLLINDLGLDMAYRSGTVVALCGTVFEHEVRSWGKGERVCYAHFMREAVRKRLDILAGGWVSQQDYQDIIPEALYKLIRGV